MTQVNVVRRFKHINTGIIGELRKTHYIYFYRFLGNKKITEFLHFSFVENSKDWIEITFINQNL